MRALQHFILFAVIAYGSAAGSESSQEFGSAHKFYRVADGKADARTYNGYRRYHAGCNHCHGPDGVGSAFASSLLPDRSTSTHSGVSFSGARAAAGTLS